MKSRLLILTILLLTGLSAAAQHDPLDQMESSEWNIISGVEMKVVKPTEIYPVYSQEIKRYENKPFELEGYIVPMKDGLKQRRFMFSTLPINQCFYCGQNGIAMMVLVEMDQPIEFTYKPIAIKGILRLGKGNAVNNPPVMLTAAKKTAG